MRTRIAKKTISGFLAVSMLFCMLAMFGGLNTQAAGNAQNTARFTYDHNPMLNPKAAADIIADPAAVYGYRPNPDSTRLGGYAKYDWTDKAVVAEMRAERIAYHDSFRELHELKAKLDAEGKTIEEIACAVSTRRNELRFEACKSEEEIETLKESNLKEYYNENGPTPEFLFNKYGSWEIVLEKAYATNAGADACLGLYDIYYHTYVFDPVSINGAKIVLSRKTFSYNGWVQKPTVRTIGGKVLKEGIDYTVKWSNPSSKNAGTYQLSVIGKDDYAGTVKATYTIQKAKNPLKIRMTKKAYRQADLKKARSFQIGASKAQGKVTYTLSKKAKKAKIRVTKKGIVKIPKNCRWGTYKITVKAAGNSKYRPGKKVVTIKITKK